MDKAVSIERRLAAMKIFHDVGVRTTCFISPIFPEITNVEVIIDRVKNQCNLIWLENRICVVITRKSFLITFSKSIHSLCHYTTTSISMVTATIGKR